MNPFVVGTHRLARRDMGERCRQRRFTTNPPTHEWPVPDRPLDIPSGDRLGPCYLTHLPTSQVWGPRLESYRSCRVQNYPGAPLVDFTGISVNLIHIPTEVLGELAQHLI